LKCLIEYEEAVTFRPLFVAIGDWQNLVGSHCHKGCLKQAIASTINPIGFADPWGRMKPQFLSYGVPVRSPCRRWATAWLSCLYVAKLKTPSAMRQKFEIQVKRDRDVWMVLAWSGLVIVGSN
jgi:hypothetical protein